MKNILVTGSDGFIGKNLICHLSELKDVQIIPFDKNNTEDELLSYLKTADFIFHVAGVNRPENVVEFEKGNTELTKTIANHLIELGKSIPIVMSSSIQAAMDNPYGVSKKKAEDALMQYSKIQKSKVYLYRLPNVFGKWCKPNYNSVVATFCHNISHNIEINISDKNKELELVYIDDVIKDFLRLLDGKTSVTSNSYYTVERVFKITLGQLASKLYQIRDIRSTLIVPDLSDDLTRFLHVTYLSYLEKNDFSYKLDMKTNQRGMLAEVLKSKQAGQIFISKTPAGGTRGNHYHHSKTEKFCVIKGKATINFRRVSEKEVIEYKVSGDNIEVVDIPPGYTHSIVNSGNDELIVLFWANEIFNTDQPDTYFLEV